MAEPLGIPRITLPVGSWLGLKMAGCCRAVVSVLESVAVVVSAGQVGQCVDFVGGMGRISPLVARCPAHRSGALLTLLGCPPRPPLRQHGAGTDNPPATRTAGRMVGLVRFRVLRLPPYVAGMTSGDLLDQAVS